MGNFTVLYDASVLYPAPVRDLLMHLALTGLFRARWTEQIHEEWITALLRDRPDLSRQRLQNTRANMNAAVLDCLVDGYENLIPALTLPHAADRHVLAAAICARADVIVTANLKHFPEDVLSGYGINAEHPDVFICNLIDLAPGPVCAAVKLHRASLRRPPKAVAEYFDTLLRNGLPDTVEALQEHAEYL